MGKVTGFIEYPRRTALDRSPGERIDDFNEFVEPLSTMTPEALEEQAGRCMDCGVPYCHSGAMLNGMTSGCPTHNLIPEWNDLVYRDAWRDALDRLLHTTNFPEFTSRVCPAPCEGSCTVGLHATPVTIKQIERAIVDRGFQEGWVVPKPPRIRTGKTVAVIGAGPSGLAAAAQLNSAGHQVTVFERQDRPGGLLIYGIPNMKLDKAVVDRRIQIMRAEGIEFVLGTEVGLDFPVKRLREIFDAVVLCLGSTRPRDLDTPGRNLQGIHFALDFLKQNTKRLLDGHTPAISAEGKDVVVIGGGDTGTDCVGTAIRQGCRSITQLEILERNPIERGPNNPWPEYPRVYKLDYGHEEAEVLYSGDPRQYAVTAKRFLGNARGDVVGMDTIDLNWQTDDKGRMRPVEVPGSEKQISAQLVLLAMGYLGPQAQLLEQMAVERDQRSNIKAAYGSFATNVEGVFAAGDGRRGQSLVVWAINEGRGAARECDRYLMGETELP